MWYALGKFVLRYRLPLLIVFFLLTGLMTYYATKVKLSYEFSKAIPTDNQKYKDYISFRDRFGDDGNMMVIGFQSPGLFTLQQFPAYQQLENDLKQARAVESVLSIPGAVMLQKDDSTMKLRSVKIFPNPVKDQEQLDSSKNIFLNLPFYRQLLYNPQTNAYLLGVRINKDVMNSKERTEVIANILDKVESFRAKTGVDVHTSGLPLIRTLVADRIQSEMKLFLLASLGLSVLILLLFFRSLSTTILSMLVVLIGVVWSLGIIYLCGYRITLLTALIPSLVVVIGIPNCIYFINKYHTSYSESRNREDALVNMVGRMGIVTLFCNIAAAIGFAVFALTSSEILKEFGIVAGLSIMVIFVVSFILIPSVLSYLSPPKPAHLRYLSNRYITSFLVRLQRWVFDHRKPVLWITAIITILSVAGIMKLRSVAYIVDDLPKDDLIYKDLRFFERNFKGVMPLEIMIDTRKKNGLTGLRALQVFERVDSLAMYISGFNEMSRPLSLAEGLRFAKQSFYDQDSTQYIMPNSFDGAFIGDYLRPSGESASSSFSNLLLTFMDTGRQFTRLSVSMADVGTERLPELVDSVRKRADQLFDTSKYDITFTGTSVTFLEGSRFIINGLKESIIWAFLLIAVCMLYLFRSFRILICSLLPNVIPLALTAGIMGWTGVPLKPSTVLIFSVALGIAVDITIRFLVNYRQELSLYNNDVTETVRATLRHTGLSIIYTSLVLIAGFVIFCASSFGGTFALGWLTSFTLLAATLTNLILLPVLLLMLLRRRK